MPHKQLLNNIFWFKLKNRLKQLLLQSEEEMLMKQSSQAPHEGVAPKPKKNIGKMMVQGKLQFHIPSASLAAIL